MQGSQTRSGEERPDISSLDWSRTNGSTDRLPDYEGPPRQLHPPHPALRRPTHSLPQGWDAPVPPAQTHAEGVANAELRNQDVAGADHLSGKPLTDVGHAVAEVVDVGPDQVHWSSWTSPRRTWPMLAMR